MRHHVRPSRGRPNKAKCQHRHFCRRLLERYGVEAGASMAQEIARKIRQGKGKFLDRQSNRVTIWSVEVNGVDMRVVYDKERHQVVTALPREQEQR